jgi:hypothetical protein
VAQTKIRLNGKGSIRAERNRVIVFLRYALDDVDAISERGAYHLRLAIEALEEEAQNEPPTLSTHEAGRA